MKITPIVIKNFKEWLKQLVEAKGIDPAVLGITSWDDKAVERFINEYCRGLTYDECKKHILNVFPVLKVRGSIDNELISMAQQELQEYFGTPYVSEAFKEFVKKYTYEQIQDMLKSINGTELEIFLDFVKGKYLAEDIDVRRVYELGVYGIRVQHIRYGSEKLFYNQMQYMGFRSAKNIYQLITNGENILLAHRNTKALVLIAIIDDVENIILPVTQSLENAYMVVGNNYNKRLALIY